MGLMYVYMRMKYSDSKFQIIIRKTNFIAFIANHFQVNQTDSDMRTPLHYAVIEGDKKAIELLIEKGANVNAVDYRNMTPLHYVAFFDILSRGYENWTEDDSLSNFNSNSFHFWLFPISNASKPNTNICHFLHNRICRAFDKSWGQFVCKGTFLER